MMGRRPNVDAERPYREALAQWMRQSGFATGHGDTFGDLIVELDWQVKELRDRRFMVNNANTKRFSPNT